MGGIAADEVVRIVARHRARRRQNRDQVRFRMGGGRLHRRHRADEGKPGKCVAQMRQDEGRGGVAGDDDEIGPIGGNELSHHFADPRDERRLAEPAVGKSGIVGGIDKAGIRAHRGDFGMDGQSAEAGSKTENLRRSGANVLYIERSRYGHGRLIARPSEKIDGKRQTRRAKCSSVPDGE